MKDKKILLADDHFVVRFGIELLIKENYPSFEIFHAENFAAIQEVLSSHPIDLIVLDATFPEGNSLSFIPQIKNISPLSKILIYSALDENIYGPNFLNIGVQGFLSKLAPEKEIKIAIETMLYRGQYLSAHLKDTLAQAYITKQPINPFEKLTSREFEVMLLMVQGMGNLEICNQLSVQPTTVTTFKNRMFKKLNIKNLSELIDLHRSYYPHL